MRRLILLRHGVTEWNQDRRFQGHEDVPLAPRGRQQAAAAAAHLAALRPSLLWASDLSRARETAGYVAAETGLVPVLDDRLREIDVGDYQGLTHDEARERFGPGPWDYADHGGESNADLAARVCAPVEEAAAALADGATGILAFHGHAIRMATIGFLGWPLEVVSTLGALDNCAWVELTDVPAGSSKSAWRLVAYNAVTPIS
ncbi:probable phosphoglycerate mutase [Nocardioides terrae]|uniref:Probable phosphoglycerate mutase n=1 Tax=Nocardioides terrae TaxID=574651 RepID=A0A1I1D8V6_9ACTN|nr:histidine phosphatase family protein [Nocardioides terrae]SFB71227.1 probable phosphoglycerate mutase [Nocardioides terrae]